MNSPRTLWGSENPETVLEEAQMYRNLRAAIEKVMEEGTATDPNNWDGDESEDFHLARFVAYLAADRKVVRQDELIAAADHLATVSSITTVEQAVEELYRLADGETGIRPRRGDQFEAWLKAQRDACLGHAGPWGTMDGVLDQYRLHADTGTPLNQHVCEGCLRGDCEHAEHAGATSA